jgi:DNA phosphorothioation-associated putative methyltransferase
MNYDYYLRLISELPFGKKLKNAVYVHAQDLSGCCDSLHSFIEQIRSRAKIGSEYNVVKFSLSEFRISFLLYPALFEDPHPQLHSSISVNLAVGKIRKHDYQHSINPPILHRKEALLDPTHPLVDIFKALTAAEESAGLYADPKIIGFKMNWESLLATKGLGYSGHELIRTAALLTLEQDSSVDIQRHKTAIARYKFSRPIQTIFEYGLLTESISLLDYGCGQGDDVNRLKQMGFMVSAWDPVYYPDGSKEPADIVNLGFVLNVIEDPIERTAVLHEAYELSRKLLVVSTLIATSSTANLGRPYKDGILTSRNTFQKYFRQEELERYIEDVLDTSAVAVGLGIFYVFHSPEEQQQFLSNRTRRSINWMEISSRARPAREPREKRQRASVYDQHKELLDAFWARMLELGRIPLKEEFERCDELLNAVGSAKKARSLYVKRFGEETLQRAFDLRQNDLRVYLALSHFRKRAPFKHLPDPVRLDIKTFLGPYKAAIEDSQALLFSAGNPEIITRLCDENTFGFQDHQALFIHRSLVPELHPVLRIYVGCAEVLYGDLGDVDIIKIHKKSGKVSLLKYDDFEGKPLPQLQERIKVNLRRQTMDVFDHCSPDRQELLYYKERYVAADHPERAKWEEFSNLLRSLGLDLQTGFGPYKHELVGFIESRGIGIELEPDEVRDESTEQE